MFLKFSSIVMGTLCAVVAAAGSAAAADAGKGEAAFKKRCVACHATEEGKNKVGPSLHGVMGRKAGVAPGYKYSDSYVEAGKQGLVWNEETVVPYLEAPKDYMEETLNDPKAKSKMVFKLKDLEERQDITAYLATLK